MNPYSRFTVRRNSLYDQLFLAIVIIIYNENNLKNNYGQKRTTFRPVIITTLFFETMGLDLTRINFIKFYQRIKIASIYFLMMIAKMIYRTITKPITSQSNGFAMVHTMVKMVL